METSVADIIIGWCHENGIRVEAVLRALFRLARKHRVTPDTMEHIFAVAITTGNNLAEGLDAFFPKRAMA